MTQWLKWLSYVRSVAGVVYAVAWTGVFSIIGLIGATLVPGRALQNRILLLWSRGLCRFFNIQITVKGLENLSTEGVLFIFNHSSHFDIVVFHAAIEKTARFGAKIELFKIPFFGAAMRKFGALPIARSDRDKVFQLYRDSVGRVHAGESFVLAAEGTRHPSPGVGEKFKSGPFIFAIDGQFPLQPIVIKGAYEILPKTAWLPAWGRWRNPVTLTILPPVSTKGLTVDDRETLKQSVQQMMTNAYARS